jgi:TetR/AcrR family transcriptional regulator, mexJK operon transcriptional repressor
LSAIDATAPPRSRKQAQIIAAAAACFNARGWGVSVEEIAQEAGVSKQTIYNVFGSKEALFRAVVARRVGLIAQAFSPEHDRDDPAEVLTRWARDYYENVLNPNALALLRSLVTAGDEVAGLAAEFYEEGPKRSRDTLARWLAQQHKARRLEIPDPALAAEHLQSLLLGHTQMKGFLGVPQDKMSADESARRVAYCVGAFMRAHAVTR